MCLTCYPTYAGAYVAARDAGLDILSAHAAARAQADAGRPTGNISQDPRFQSIVSIMMLIHCLTYW